MKTVLLNDAPYVLSILRVIAGFLFLQHGTQKLFAYPMPPPGGKPPVASFYGVAGLLEFIGGVLILIGLLTRPVAFLLSGEMAVAYFQKRYRSRERRGLRPGRRAADQIPGKARQL